MTKSQKTPESVAEALRLRPFWEAAKRDLGLTQVKLAALLGVGQSSVNRWISGEQPIPTERLMELAALLHFDPIDVRPECSRFIRPLRDLSISESAAILGGMYDKMDEQSKTAVETVVRTLFDASKKPRSPER